ncbi:MAG: S8 family serine peptidase [candidate division KSB1 bacterium]|nr:S8 family serine peptidase [candidate division KSB1 bacterium]
MGTAPAAVDLASSASQSPQYWSDRVIIKFAAGSIAGPQRATLQAYSLPAKTAAILSGFGAVETEQLFPARSGLFQKNSRRIDLSTIYQIRFAQSIDIMKVLKLLRQQPEVIYAEPVYLREICYDPNDPLIGNQQYLNLIKAREAWELTRGDTSVVIAIVDTGVDWQHPDLAANIWRNHREIPNNGIDDDRNGFVDDIRGWDFGGENNKPDNDPREDTPQHGTLVAGIAAAVTDNNLGMAGVAFKCKIMPVKASRKEVTRSILFGFEGIVYAAENGADIINCSWGGGGGASQFEQEVIDYATDLGALVVAAAGNNNSSGLFYPAAYRNVLTVANTTIEDRRYDDVTYGSNYGYWIDVAAPGTNILGTWQPDGYMFGTGTSLASPVAAGIAALVKAVHKDWTPSMIAEQVRLAADNIDNKNPGFERQLGFGRVNALRAVTIKTPGVRLVDYKLREATGDGDGIFDANEEIAVSIKLTNFLEPVSNLSVTLTDNSSFVEIVSAAKNVGTIRRGDTVAVAGTFNFRIAANVPGSHLVTLYVNFSAPGYNDWQGFTAIVRPLYGDIAVGNVATTVTSFGAIGFDDYGNSSGGGQIGRGFEFPIDSASALYHGGLILATASNRVSDVSYGNAAYDRFDFVTSAGGELNLKSGEKATIEATSRFNDSAADAPIGLTVDQKIYAWANAPWNDFIILEYSIRNSTTQTISNLFAGFYLDWDIDKSDENFANWDNANQLGYEWATGSAYYGVAAVSPATAKTYRAVKNPDFVWGNKFTDAVKYQFMTQIFQVISSDGPNDWSQLLSYGPYSLAAGQSVTVAFAVLGGADLADLQANARAAREAFLTVGVNSDNETSPVQFRLAQNTPNPFARRTGRVTAIQYSLAEPGPITLRIFNLLGQEVATLAQGYRNRGNYVLHWDGRDRRGLLVPSGVYFYRLQTKDFTTTKKLIVVD